MADEGENSERRWNDTPGIPNVFDYRLLVAEKRVDEHEHRLRATERDLLNMAKDLRTVSEDTSEIKEYLRKNVEVGGRNLVAIVIAATTVILTVLGTHFLK